MQTEAFRNKIPGSTSMHLRGRPGRLFFRILAATTYAGPSREFSPPFWNSSNTAEDPEEGPPISTTGRAPTRLEHTQATGGAPPEHLR